MTGALFYLPYEKNALANLDRCIALVAIGICSSVSSLRPR
jgi:hypothetical protein